MTFDFTINALLSYLRENQQEPELQIETNQVFISYKIKGYEVPCFFLLNAESELLQIVAYLPYHVPQNRLGEIARMLHLLNRELDMPGFGMDEQDKLMFYRAVLPCPGKKIDKKLFNMYLGTTRLVCDTFMQAIGMIVSGNATVDQVLNSRTGEGS